MFEDKDSLKEMLELGGFVGLAQINLVAGDLEYNYNKICDIVEKSDNLNLDGIFFPKNSLKAIQKIIECMLFTLGRVLEIMSPRK